MGTYADLFLRMPSLMLTLIKLLEVAQSVIPSFLYII